MVARAFEPLSKSVVKQIAELGVNKIKVVNTTPDEGIMIKCLKKDPAKNEEEALKDIYRRLRPGDPPTAANARALLKRLFFDPKRYDLGRVGRYKINQKLGLKDKEESRILTKHDLVAATKYLLRLKKGEGSVDDIDHLGSRRIRTVGELLANQCRVGLSRTERLVKERMTLFDQSVEQMAPQKLINPKALSAVIRDFFGRSQLSQFMDQINPLAELTHKRRLSALGPGGLSRDRAGFEVRDVHPSHYGRICPIETPEGPNIGLIASLATFARINDFGFLETPYRKVENGRVTNHIDYLTADREEQFIIAQANSPIDDKGKFTTDRVVCRARTDFIDVEPARVDYMDVSPKQLVSIAASLIPFLEHDDANRALMGSNMQRQAVPLLVTEAPLVATGLEDRVARDSRAVVVAEESGKVASVSGDQVIITEDGKLPETKKKIKHDPEKGVWVYPIRKFMRSNAATCINQKTLVHKGDHVKKGQVIADGPCTQNSELALGRNVLVAFMPWNGYNFEDAILISEKIVKEDIFTSIHIDEFEVAARDTKLGPEEITRDIPNLGDEALKNLGPDGVIRIGAEVKPGDILVGKITPKSETELAPEERLLRAIFGEKAADVKDTSLKIPSGTYGIVMDVKVSSKKETDRDSKSSAGEEKRHAKQIEDDHKKKTDELRDQLTEALSNILLGEKIPLDVVNSETGEIIIPANRKITKTLLRKLATVYDRIEIDPSPIRNKINEIIGSFKKKFDDLQMQYDEEMERAEAGEGVEAGIVKSVKVYIASKRKLSVGDKMAGRHGNKGVVARIVKEEDMPFLADGTPVDIVLNPLGVPSRMNVGQVLETHLGWAAKILGLKFATPVFDGIKEKDIRNYLKEAKLPEHAKTILYDGCTGEAVRSGNCRRLHLHDEARPPGRGQDSRPRGRALFARHAAAARRQGAIRRPALRRNGSVGDGSLRRGLHAAGIAHRQVRRRAGPHAHLREHCQGRQRAGGGHSRILQRARQGNAVARPRCEGRLRESGGTPGSIRRDTGVALTRKPFNQRGNKFSYDQQQRKRARIARTGQGQSGGLRRDHRRVARCHPVVEQRRSQKSRNHQLPHVQAGKGRPVLRTHFRPRQGLGMFLRQIQAHQAPRHRLRPLRRGGDARPRPPRAHGPHRTGRAGRATSGFSSACRRASASCST